VIITVGYIWVEKNNQTTLADDFDCEPEELFSELNDMAEYWDNPGLEKLDKLDVPESWGAPEFDEPELGSFITQNESDVYFKSFLGNDWKEFIAKLEGTTTFAIWTPNGSTPWDWYELPNEKKSEAAAPGGQVFFDQYRLGMMMFETSHEDVDIVIEEFQSKLLPVLEKYCSSPGPYGLGNLNHECDSECASSPCIRIVGLPAFLSIEG
jgi:hypothetical protein